MEHSYGIVGQTAPELKVKEWIDKSGKRLERPPQLADYAEKFVILFCFQNWCQGCHSIGIPALQVLINAFEDDESIVFLAIQTVFEGQEANTYERIIEIQKKYGLNIPIGHDPGNKNTADISQTMYDYRSGGTPWFIFIDEKRKVVFNDFHFEVQKAVDGLRERVKAH